MTDEALFGADGTQALPPDPVLPDPLGGLVTGFAFSDVTPDETVVETPPVPGVTASTQARRRPAGGVKRPAARPATVAAQPALIPVAQSLPSRPRQIRQAPVARPTAIPVTSAVRGRQSVRGQPTPATLAARAGTVPGRRSGVGCSVFLFLVVLLVIGFIVLGIVFGHTGGLDTGSG